MIAPLTLICGTAVGTIAGLIPGLHPNNIAPVLVTLPLINPDLFIFVLAAVVSFTLSSHIPSILLGAPTGENLSVLPGHYFTNQGNGPRAIEITLNGAMVSLMLTPLIAGLFIFLVPTMYPALSPIIPFVLVAATILVMKSPQGILISALAAALGLMALEETTIMPMLTGFFGTSTLIVSLARKDTPEKQRTTSNNLKASFENKRAAALSTFLSTFFGAIPAISSAITATIGKAFGEMDREEYLSFIGASNLTYVTVSFLALISLGKTRSGAAVALAATRFPRSPVIPLITIMTSASLAYLLIKIALPSITKAVNKASHFKLNSMALVFLIGLNVFLTGPKGIIVLITSTAIGITAIRTRASRINCMASLTVPTALLLI